MKTLKINSNDFGDTTKGNKMNESIINLEDFIFMMGVLQIITMFITVKNRDRIEKIEQSKNQSE